MCIGWAAFKSQWFIINGPQALTWAWRWLMRRRGEAALGGSLPWRGVPGAGSLWVSPDLLEDWLQHTCDGCSSLRAVLPTIYSPLELPWGQAWGESVRRGCEGTSSIFSIPRWGTPVGGELKTLSCMSNRPSPWSFEVLRAPSRQDVLHPTTPWG